MSRASACRASPPTAGTIRLVFAIDSTPGSTTARSAASTARGASRSLCSGPRRARWRASRRPNGASCALPSRVRPAASRRLRAAVCALFEERLLPLASGVDAAFVALLAAHVRLVHDAALALRLSRRPLGNPLRRYNVLAPLDARLSGSQRHAIVSRTRAAGMLRARLVAAALRERLSRRQRADLA